MLKNLKSFLTKKLLLERGNTGFLTNSWLNYCSSVIIWRTGNEGIFDKLSWRANAQSDQRILTLGSLNRCLKSWRYVMLQDLMVKWTNEISRLLFYDINLKDLEKSVKLLEFFDSAFWYKQISFLQSHGHSFSFLFS